jgi:hypothetical protein
MATPAFNCVAPDGQSPGRRGEDFQKRPTLNFLGKRSTVCLTPTTEMTPTQHGDEQWTPTPMTTPPPHYEWRCANDHYNG